MDAPPILRLTKPKRSLNAYNIFFQKERERLLETLPETDKEKPK